MELEDGGHRRVEELEAGLASIRESPRDEGPVALIVRRPGVGARETLDEAEIDAADGLVGDNWRVRGSSMTPDRSAHPDMQLTLMNARAIDLIAGDRERWALAGDQLFVDLDLGVDNMPAGTRLALGSAVLEITELPHTGCKKFATRFGVDAVKFVNSPEGRRLRLRGVNARVVESGTVRVGDLARKL